MSRGSEQAYPVPSGDPDYLCPEGMTLREHYAGLAMQGLLACGVDGHNWVHDTAKHAVDVADALIARLAETEGESK